MARNAIDYETVRWSTWGKLQREGLLLLNPEYVERAIKWGHAHNQLSSLIVMHIRDDLR